MKSVGLAVVMALGALACSGCQTPKVLYIDGIDPGLYEIKPSKDQPSRALPGRTPHNGTTPQPMPKPKQPLMEGGTRNLPAEPPQRPVDTSRTA